MKLMPRDYSLDFDNILYIGDEPRACLAVIEDFNSRLLGIEQDYKDWFRNRTVDNGLTGQDKLQYHIQYHFEGGIAVFKFKDDGLPEYIRRECLAACRSLAEEQLYYAS
jgi:hypothetical protein